MHLLQNDILAAAARGEAVAVTTARICVRLESLLPGAICAVLRVDDDDRYADLAGPSLDRKLRKTFIGVRVGSADDLFRRVPEHPCEALEIANDAVWRNFAHLLLEAGLRACWAMPVAGQDGRVLAGLCVYFRRPRRLSPSEMEILRAGVDLCAIALERSQQSGDLRPLAYRDILTGLPNRAAFNAVSSRAASARGDFGALLLIDLDDLKRINTTFGRQAGDRLIETAAARIKRIAAPLTVFRRGGGEFAVIIPTGHAMPSGMSGLAHELLAALGSPASHTGMSTNLRASIGGSALENGATIEALEQRAVLALAHAKESRKGGFVAYSGDLGAEVSRRTGVIRDVDLALSEGRIDAHYQPIVNLQTGELSGLEALFRLITPEGVAVPAGEYFEATTDPLTATRLTQRMLTIVARDMRTWREQGVAVRAVGINASSEDFRRGCLLETIQSVFGREGVPLEQLVLEVTEDVYMGEGGDGVGALIARVRTAGMKVALDDFGTGFASLAHLLAVPVDYIKIDRSFTAQIMRRPHAAAIVEGIIGIAGKLGVEVVAEGVETSDQAGQLQTWACERGQGLLFSRALDRNDVLRLLRDSPHETVGTGLRSKPIIPVIQSRPEVVLPRQGPAMVRYAVLLCGKDWRVISERRQLGRFETCHSALQCALGLAREAAGCGAAIELLYSGPGGELRTYGLPSYWRGPAETPSIPPAGGAGAEQPVSREYRL